MADADDNAAAVTKHLWERRGSVIYKLRLSVLYHLKRERFYDLADKFVTTATAISATAAVGVILKQVPQLDIAVAIVTAAFSLVQVIFNFAEKARHHNQVAAEFRRLLADGEAAGQRWTEEQCDQFNSRMIAIEVAERAPLAALVAACQNQLAIATGKPENIVPLRFYERLLMHVIDFDAAELLKRQQRQAALSSQ